MLKAHIAVVVGSGLLSVGIAFAQSTEVTIRQGDIIEWVAESGGNHQVRFGGPVGGTMLTPVPEVKERLENFVPTLTEDGAIALAPEEGKPSGSLLKAKVKDAAEVGKTFFFTCGIHTNAMISRPFKIEAKVAGQGPRTYRIKGATGQNWILEVPIDTTPPAP